MARTTPEHERLVDDFDAIITFSYAYEWQQLQNNKIDELMDLGDKVRELVFTEARLLFIGIEDKIIAIASILNKLQEAVALGSCPEAIKWGDFWLNMPKSMSAQSLEDKYDDEFRDMVIMVMGGLSYLGKLPNEIQPFVTIKQVEETLVKVVDEMKGDKAGKFRMPLHKELMASLIHQHFLKTLSIEQNTFEQVDAYEKLTKSYCKKAINKFIVMARMKYIDDAVVNLLPVAKNIHVEIDRYYGWSQICHNGIKYEELLVWSGVKGLPLKGHLQDKENKAQNNGGLNAFESNIKYVANLYGHPTVSKGKFKRYLYDSSVDSILIDGNSIQNHLVMIFPYDKPFPDLQDKLNSYASYISNRVETYGKNYGHSSEYEDEVKGVTAFINLKVPYKRLSLSDSSSILPHICALLCLRYERLIENSGRSKKRQSLDVYEIIKSLGIRYSIESVEKVRKYKEKNMINILKKLHNL
ncbi:hypothetical protein [Methylovulum psychrotolerans]|uniref:Uncharacterized protein n=1 Tax=Methylovulum psychrotolerans TaxID=1704499 RepID=A0A1Z4BVF7_9GAMM|nr:hypothetical protein [Methylovulum psychrotolerans]ASF45233.1 hypothetical protein CEK71_03675 [Methylovulum psychrotolerans]